MEGYKSQKVTGPAEIGWGPEHCSDNGKKKRHPRNTVVVELIGQ